MKPRKEFEILAIVWNLTPLVLPGFMSGCFVVWGLFVEEDDSNETKVLEVWVKPFTPWVVVKSIVVPGLFASVLVRTITTGALGVARFRGFGASSSHILSEIASPFLTRALPLQLRGKQKEVRNWRSWGSTTQMYSSALLLTLCVACTSHCWRKC